MDARFRKLYPRIWRHAEFRRLDQAGQLLALYCLTGPQSNRAGLFTFSPGTAAEDLGIPTRALHARMARVCEVFGWRFDAEARVLFVPSWWTWNPPENPNVLRAAFKDVRDVPATALLQSFLEGTAAVSERFGVWFVEPSPEPSPEPSRHGSPNQSKAEQSKAKQIQAAGDAPPAPASRADAAGSPEQFLEVWNTETTAPLPKAVTLGKARRRKIAARLREHELDWWRTAIRRVEASSFLRGSSARGWVATVDWLVASDANVGKLLEGAYDDRAPSVARPANAAPSAEAFYERALWCRHSPKCASYEGHELRLRREPEELGETS